MLENIRHSSGIRMPDAVLCSRTHPHPRSHYINVILDVRRLDNNLLVNLIYLHEQNLGDFSPSSVPLTCGRTPHFRHVLPGRYLFKSQNQVTPVFLRETWFCNCKLHFVDAAGGLRLTKPASPYVLSQLRFIYRNCDFIYRNCDDIMKYYSKILILVKISWSKIRQIVLR